MNFNQNINMTLIEHPTGNYAFLKGIGPYSSGVVAMPGFEIVHARMAQPIPLHLAYEQIVRRLGNLGRDIKALCGMQLRIPAPLSFEGFYDFNQQYQHKLMELGLFLDEVNPLARTNIAIGEPGINEPVLHAFSYTINSDGRITIEQHYLITGFEAGTQIVPSQEVIYQRHTHTGLRHGNIT